MKLGVVGYVPPRSWGCSEAFMSNLAMFPTNLDTTLLSDDSSWGLQSCASPISSSVGRPRVWSMSNRVWKMCLAAAAKAGYEYFLYVESDCRFGQADWAKTILDEALAQPGIVCAGTPVVWNLNAAAPDVAAAIRQKVDAWTRATGIPIPLRVIGRPWPRTMFYPNGALGVYSTRDMLNLFGQFQIDLLPWDMWIGVCLGRTGAENIKARIGIVTKALSLFRDVPLNLEQREDALQNRGFVAVHQIKDKWLPARCPIVSKSTPIDAKDVCLVAMGRYGDIMNVLPIALDIASKHGAPRFVVSRQFADILDGVSYVRPVVDPRNYKDAVAVENEHRGQCHRLIQCQSWAGQPLMPMTEPFNVAQWRRAGYLDKWDSLPPLSFDRRSAEREGELAARHVKAEKPSLLVSLTGGETSKFPCANRIQEHIYTHWSEAFNIVDIAAITTHRIYDLLGLYDRAAGLIVTDTATLHLANASQCPVFAYIANGIWHGSLPRFACQAVRYADAESNLAKLETWLQSRLDGFNVVRVAHVHEWHEPSDPSERFRQEAAARSWAAIYQLGILDVPYRQYKRDSLAIGDTRRLPYLKDVLEPGISKVSTNGVVMLTNDDTILHPDIANIVERHVKEYGACSSLRCEIASPAEAIKQPSEHSRNRRFHIGRDLFGFSVDWLTKHWNDIPDCLLGASDWDIALAILMRHYHKLPTSMEFIGASYPQTDIPDGYVLHLPHAPVWSQRSNIDTAPSQKHNRQAIKAVMNRLGISPGFAW